jgi:ATP-binding cassette subfamily F protein 3
MLSFTQVSLSRGTKLIFSDLSLNVFHKQKIGIVGKNGCGKSTLFALIMGKLSPDAGECALQAHISISNLAQHIPDSDEKVVDYVLAGDEAYHQWQVRLQKAMQDENEQEMMLCHEHLQNMGAYSKTAQAASILAGLGFSEEEQQRTVRSFSGGWRMRIGLARCLMKPADLYLLDEPTNHLDLPAIIWLERWIKQLSATVLLISHDREFLDNTVEKILHIEHEQAKLYSGHYSYFENARAEQLLMQQAQYERQQKQIHHMMAFVNKFKAKASKAKQAQSRMKAIERMELVAQAHLDSEFSFEFLRSPPAGHPLIKCLDVGVGYHQDTPIIQNINFQVQAQDRIGLLGKNGQGKSTFIKTLIGEIPALNGEVFRASGLKIGYFAQHQIESLDMSLSPMQTIQELDLKAKEQDIRQFLGGFNFCGDMAVGSINNFSGGEKARLALAKLVWQKPNLLLLDEPTNHLDLDMRTSIEIALQTYEGALILISHDRHLIQTCVNDFYLVANQSLTAFDGDLYDYYQWLQNSTDKTKSSMNTATSNQGQYKEIKALQNKIKRLEDKMSTISKQLKELHDKLCDEGLYDISRQADLQKLQTKEAQLNQELEQIEEEWLDCTNILEGGQ